MSLLILDTNIVSFLMRGNAQPGSAAASLAARYVPHLVGHTLGAFITEGELIVGGNGAIGAMKFAAVRGDDADHASVTVELGGLDGPAR